MGEEKEILLHGKVCAYLTGRLMGDPLCFSELVVQIAFTEWTPDDHLRHAAFVGIRQDKNARDVVREPG